MMGRFYLDMEITNGNCYLTDIQEIALVAEEWKPQVCKATLSGITNRTIETHGVPFRDVMDGLVAFIRREATERAIIIAHLCK